jgi:hypothetical protein
MVQLGNDTSIKGEWNGKKLKKKDCGKKAETKDFPSTDPYVDANRQNMFTFYLSVKNCCLQRELQISYGPPYLYKQRLWLMSMVVKL